MGTRRRQRQERTRRRTASDGPAPPPLLAGEQLSLAARLATLDPCDRGQAGRLDRFRAAYPEVRIGSGDGYWQAVVPRRDGEAVLTRYTLAALLDRLDEMLTPASG